MTMRNYEDNKEPKASTTCIGTYDPTCCGLVVILKTANLLGHQAVLYRERKKNNKTPQWWLSQTKLSLRLVQLKRCMSSGFWMLSWPHGLWEEGECFGGSEVVFNSQRAVAWG